MAHGRVKESSKLNFATEALVAEAQGAEPQPALEQAKEGWGVEGVAGDDDVRFHEVIDDGAEVTANGADGQLLLDQVPCKAVREQVDGAAVVSIGMDVEDVAAEVKVALDATSV